MRVSEDVVPFAEFRANASRLIRAVREDGRPKVITQHGRAAAVLVSAEWFDRVNHDEYVRNAIREGLSDLDASRSYSTEEVMADMDEVIERVRRRKADEASGQSPATSS